MKFLEWLKESEFGFWKKVYGDNEAHWLDKNPSNLTKRVIKKYRPFNNILEIGCAAGIDTFLLAQNCKSINTRSTSNF